MDSVMTQHSGVEKKKKNKTVQYISGEMFTQVNLGSGTHLSVYLQPESSKAGVFWFVAMSKSYYFFCFSFFFSKFCYTFYLQYKLFLITKTAIVTRCTRLSRRPVFFKKCNSTYTGLTDSRKPRMLNCTFLKNRVVF